MVKNDHKSYGSSLDMHQDSIQDVRGHLANVYDTISIMSDRMDRVEQRIASISTKLQQKIDQTVAPAQNALRTEFKG